MTDRHTKFTAVALAAVWVTQTWAAAPEPNAPKAPRSVEARPLLMRGIEDRWTPTDTIMTLERNLRLLELTSEQWKKVQGVIEAKNEALTGVRKAYAEAGKALNDACSEGKEAAIRAAAVKVGQTLGDLQVLRSKVAAEMRAVLTAEQLKKLEQIKTDANQNMMRPIRPRTDTGTPGAARPVPAKPNTSK